MVGWQSYTIELESWIGTGLRIVNLLYLQFLCLLYVSVKGKDASSKGEMMEVSFCFAASVKVAYNFP